MKRMVIFLLAWSALAAESGGPSINMDSTRGALLFESQRCIQCHSINGKGGHAAPDLGRAIDRSYTPAVLASTLWNHAPAMWTAIRGTGEPPPVLNEQSAADLFAFFYAARFFEPPGDAARGKRIFGEKHCSACHGVGAAAASKALPPAQWGALGDSIALAAAMWNHAPQMEAELSLGAKRWPKLTAQDFSDLLVYVRNTPGRSDAGTRFQISGGSDGEVLFHSKGCAACHASGKLSLPERLRGLTLTGIAAQMWDHAPLMHGPPVLLDPAEMRALLGYLWVGPFFEERGSLSAGRRAFAARRCAVCHDDPASGAPRIAPRAGGFNGIVMVAALWKHGPAMLDRMDTKGMAWQHFNAGEMSNLIAYLNSGERK